MADFSTGAHRELYDNLSLGEKYLTANRPPQLARLEREYVERYFPDRQAPLLEGGCGGGRISFALESAGYTNVTAFDFSPMLLADAKRTAAARDSKVRFHEADACQLKAWGAGAFQYIIYGAQLLSLIPMPARLSAFREAIRLLRPGGVFIFSVLHRRVNWRRRAMVKAFALRNWCCREDFSPLELPYLRLSQRWNWRAWLGGGPTVTWYAADEIQALAQALGLQVLEYTDTVGRQERRKGMAIYLACVHNDA